RCAVLLHVAPLAHRLLVAPEGERDEAPRRRDALEALDRDEAVEAPDDVVQAGGEVEVFLLAPGGRELEDDGDHFFPILLAISVRHSPTGLKPGCLRASASAQDQSSASESFRSMGMRCGWCTYHGVSMNSSMRLPSGSRK